MKKQQKVNQKFNKKENLIHNIRIQTLFINTFRTYIYESFRKVPFELQVKNAIREMFFILIQRKKDDSLLDELKAIFPPNDIRYKFKVEILEIEINTEKNLDLPNNNWFNVGNCENVLELAIRYKVDVKSNIINKSFELTNLYSTILVKNSAHNGRTNGTIDFANNHAIINYGNNMNINLRDLRRPKMNFNNLSVMKYYRYLDKLSTSSGLKKFYNISQFVSVVLPNTGIMNILNSISEFSNSNIKKGKYSKDLINSAFIDYFNCVKDSVNNINHRNTSKDDRFVLSNVIFEQFGFDFNFSSFYEGSDGPYLSYNNYH